MILKIFNNNNTNNTNNNIHPYINKLLAFKCIEKKQK